MRTSEWAWSRHAMESIFATGTYDIKVAARSKLRSGGGHGRGLGGGSRGGIVGGGDNRGGRGGVQGCRERRNMTAHKA